MKESVKKLRRMINEQDDTATEEDVAEVIREMAERDLSDIEDAGAFHELLRLPLFHDSELANAFQSKLNEFVTEAGEQLLDIEAE